MLCTCFCTSHGTLSSMTSNKIQILERECIIVVKYWRKVGVWVMPWLKWKCTPLCIDLCIAVYNLTTLFFSQIQFMLPSKEDKDCICVVQLLFPATRNLQQIFPTSPPSFSLSFSGSFPRCKNTYYSNPTCLVCRLCTWVLVRANDFDGMQIKKQ